MASQNKNLWVVAVLVAAGIVILLLSLKQGDNPSSAVSMQEVIDQKPSVADKDPVPSPAIVTSPVHGKEAGFAVQVYSFKEQQRAEAALSNLKKQGYDNAYVEMSDLGVKGTWFRVRIGDLKDEAQAKALLEDIRKNFNGGFIVKPTK